MMQAVCQHVLPLCPLQHTWAVSNIDGCTWSPGVLPPFSAVIGLHPVGLTTHACSCCHSSGWMLTLYCSTHNNSNCLQGHPYLDNVTHFAASHLLWSHPWWSHPWWSHLIMVGTSPRTLRGLHCCSTCVCCFGGPHVSASPQIEGLVATCCVFVDH